MRRIWHASAFVLALLAVAARPADAASLTLVWDPSPDPAVTGYKVYVGPSAGTYTDTYDVGPRTLFVLPAAVPGLTYYFAVASYSAHAAGPLSAEISAVAVGTAAGAPAPMATREGSAAAPSSHLGSIGSLAGTPDGGLLFIEDETRVRAVRAGGAVLPGALLTARPGARLTGLAVDWRFARTRFVFVAETMATRDGRRELTIVRYRELDGSLGEPAALVAGLPLPSSGEAAFTVDHEGRVYIAMPASPSGGDRDEVYAARILRFAADGTVPADNQARSPVVSFGFGRPSSLVWHPSGEVWAAGGDAAWPPLVRLRLASAGEHAWPLVPHAVRQTGATERQRIRRFAFAPRQDPGTDDALAFAVNEDGTVTRLVIGREITVSPIALDPAFSAVDVAASAGRVYLVLRPAEGAAGGDRIVTIADP